MPEIKTEILFKEKQKKKCWGGPGGEGDNSLCGNPRILGDIMPCIMGHHYSTKKHGENSTQI
jgi:hypothetical protein